MKNTTLRFGLLTAAVMTLVLPSSALAGSSWSLVEVDQWQTGSNAVSLVQGEQEFSIKTKTTLHDEAEASSDTWGYQFGQVRDGSEVMLDQEQSGRASSALVWGDDIATEADCNEDDDEDVCDDILTVDAVAETEGSAVQKQHAESDLLSVLKQEASLNQKSKVDSNKSYGTAWAKQDLLVDADQEQSLSGETHAEGRITHPLSRIFDVSAGSKLIQRVRVAIDNLITL